MPKPKKEAIALAACAIVLVSLLCGGCRQEECSQAATPVIAVLDVEKVLKESKASEMGRAHLAEARKRLQTGKAELWRTWGKMPDEERKEVYAKGLQALDKQMDNEEAAANQVVLTLMKQKAQEWRKNSSCQYVIAKQNFIDAAESVDITNEVIALMNKETPQFAELPTVKVHEPMAKPKPARQAAPSQNPKDKPQPKR